MCGYIFLHHHYTLQYKTLEQCSTLYNSSKIKLTSQEISPLNFNVKYYVKY